MHFLEPELRKSLYKEKVLGKKKELSQDKTALCKLAIFQSSNFELCMQYNRGKKNYSTVVNDLFQKRNFSLENFKLFEMGASTVIFYFLSKSLGSAPDYNKCKFL